MIVGITGKKYAGKSTAAMVLLEHDFNKMSFAGTLKKMTTILLEDLGLTKDEIHRAMVSDKEAIIPQLGVSGRHIMQTLGTDWGRKMVHPDVWVKTTEVEINRGPGDDYVFDDVRFDNEAEMITRLGGVLLHLTRDSEGAGDNHDSEQGISDAFDVEEIDNNGDLEHLEDQIVNVLLPM